MTETIDVMERKKLRLRLMRGLMADLELQEAARLTVKGKCADPGLYWEALNVVWEWLGPDGRRELDLQSGIDSLGGTIEGWAPEVTS